MITRVRIAHFSLVIAGLIFGGNYWIAKSLMPHYLGPLQIVFLRGAGAFILFWLVHTLFVREHIQQRDYVRLAAAGLLGITLNQTMFFAGLNFTTPVDAAIIHLCNPLIVLVLAALFIKETISGRKIIGIIAGAVGAAIMILYGKTTAFSSATFWGNILIFLNTTAYAGYLIVVNPLMAKYHPITVMKWVFTFGFLFVLPFTIWPFMKIDYNRLGLIQWGSVMYIVLGVTFLTYLLTIFALKYLQASQVSYYIYFQPLFASIIALWAGIEILTWWKIVAGVILFAGVYLVNSNARSKHPLQKMTKGH